jgi:hypothetical protein
MMKYQCNETINDINKLQSLTTHSNIFLQYKQLNNCKLYFTLIPAAIRPCGYEATHWGECGLESHLGHGCLSPVSVVPFRVVVSVSASSLIQWSPNKYGVSVYKCKPLILIQWSPNKYGVFVHKCKALILRSPWLTTGCYAMGGDIIFLSVYWNIEEPVTNTSDYTTHRFPWVELAHLLAMVSNLSQIPARAGGQDLTSLLEKEITGEDNKW